MHLDNSNPLRVFVITNRLFEWSQNFVTRELMELNRLGVEMMIGSRDVLHRDDLSVEERGLLDRLFLIRENPFSFGYLARHLEIAVTRPTAYFTAWKTLFSLRHKPSKFPRGVICLCRAAGIAKQVERYGANLIHAHFLTAQAETALYLSKLTGIPFGVVAYAHDIYVDNSGLAGKLKHASYVNATTRFNQDYMTRLIPNKHEKIVTLYYGIYTSPELKSRLAHDKFTFLAVGRLVQKKGFKYLIEACALLKERGYEFQCEIVGKGPLEAELISHMTRLKVDDCVTLRGYVPPNEMSEAYRRGDVLVAPCVVADNGDVDGLPNVCLEAMDHGLPIITTTVSGIPEGVEDGVNGWLVPPDDSEAFADAMIKALTTTLSSMRVASFEMAAKKFDVRKNIYATRDLMNQYRRKQ